MLLSLVPHQEPLLFTSYHGQFPLSTFGPKLRESAINPQCWDREGQLGDRQYPSARDRRLQSASNGLFSALLPFDLSSQSTQFLRVTETHPGDRKKNRGGELQTTHERSNSDFSAPLTHLRGLGFQGTGPSWKMGLIPA